MSEQDTELSTALSQSDYLWWKGGVFYQIYPRSFRDSNGDGIGDLAGITSKLNYVADLGADGIWISPFFRSPMKDFGYDISDYCAIDPIFGTMNDFEMLLKRAHLKGLKIIIDLVLSHTSDQHDWFTDSTTGGDKKDWYVWADAKTDPDTGERAPPNNWVSVFGGPAWSYHEERGQYYLHNFLPEQPDLNFHNPAVQDAILETVKFWLDKGVDGLRLDVVNFYFHDQELRDNPLRDEAGFATQFEGDDPYSQQNHIYDKSRPENLDFIRRLRALSDDYKEVMLLGEIGDDNPYECAASYTDEKDLLHTTYNLSLMSGEHKALTPALIRGAFETWNEVGGASWNDKWPSWALSNHDVVRAASRFHPDPVSDDGYPHHPELSQMLVVLLCCLRGTMYLYQGEELGLPEAKIAFDDLQDPWGKHLWPEWQGRDGCRTPMVWNHKDGAGFTDQDVTPWLPFGQGHQDLNVNTQKKTLTSTLNITRNVLAWRKTYPAFRDGDITFYDANNKNFLVFERINDSQKILCLFNFSSNEQKLDLPEICYSYPDLSGLDGVETIKPYGFVILETKL